VCSLSADRPLDNPRRGRQLTRLSPGDGLAIPKEAARCASIRQAHGPYHACSAVVDRSPTAAHIRGGPARTHGIHQKPIGKFNRDNLQSEKHISVLGTYAATKLFVLMFTERVGQGD